LYDAASRKIRIGGFIGQAGLSRHTRAQQLIFVNGRAIESGIITAAIREGYHTALMKGQYPITFLFLDLDPAAVDVNVHPAKREVRFRDPTGVREAIVGCVQQSLERTRAEWQEKFRAPTMPPSLVPPKQSLDLEFPPESSSFLRLSICRRAMRIGSSATCRSWRKWASELRASGQIHLRSTVCRLS